MMKKLFKNRLFLIGFLFIVLMIAASLVHSVFFNGHIPKTRYQYDNGDGGQIIAKAPFSPGEVSVLGTDEIGRHLEFLLLQGVKFTIGIALVVAAFRILIGFIIGFSFNGILSRFRTLASGFTNAFYYIPAALICYVLLDDIIVQGQFEEMTYTFWQRATFELIVLTVVAVPTTSLLIANQLRQLYREEFITAANLLGGSRLHVLKRHVFPHIWPRLLIQFGQEVVQVLILLIHLGFFHLLFGGTIKIKGDPTHMDIFISLSSEWSGMLGNAFDHMDHWPFFFLVPMIAFTLVILAFNWMIRGMEDVFWGYRPSAGKHDKTAGKQLSSGEPLHFDFIHKENG